MKNYYALSLLTGSSAFLITALPAVAASNQITGVQLNNDFKQGIKLKLETNSTKNKIDSFLLVSDNNKLETTLINTELNLPEGKKFTQINPTPEIAEISLSQVDKNHTKIAITTNSKVTLEPKLEQKGTELIFNLKQPPTKNSILQKIPLISEIKTLKKNFDKFLVAQGIKPATSPSQDVLVPNPEIIISSDAEEFNNNLQPSYEQPYLPRAIAPPVGDIAVSNISTFPDTIDLGSRAIVPRLVLRDAPVREVLSLLARQAGLNIVFATEEEEQAGRNRGRRGEEEEIIEGPTVSLDLENQSVQEVFDSILLISGLTASRRGNIVYIGEKLPAQARNLISRTLRLNQVRAENAALFLASQGAQGQRLTTEVEETVDPETGRVVQRKELPAILLPLGGAGENEEDNTRALLLKGLQVATDDRLNSITLVGEARKVEMATAFLTQLDARRRQVAVNVKVIDVNLNNQDIFNSSFSFGVGDTFFIQDNGAATLRFGGTSPARRIDINSETGRLGETPIIPNPFSGTDTFVDFNSTFEVPGTVPGTINNITGEITPPGTGTFFNRRSAISSDPFTSGVTDFEQATFNTFEVDGDGNISFTEGTDGTVTSALPSLFQYPKKFLALLDAQIISGNAKILTDPTLVVQEGQQATVKLAQNVIESIKTEIDGESGTRTITPVIVEAGLVLTVNVERIDDNGFIALSVSPTVSSIGGTQEFDSGSGATNLLNLLSKRELSSGLVRLRDNQTLILSGIIQDQERTTVSKVPILGDIPLLGSLFRSTDKTNERAEVIVLLTPQVIDEQAGFGYNYNPSKTTREMLRRGGLKLPGNP